jgi:hypothetical protein
MMNDIEIIETLRKKLSIPIGRHLYGVMGSYPELERFTDQLQKATYEDNLRFPQPISVSSSILNQFSDEEFHRIVTDEAKRPEPTRKSIEEEFNAFVRRTLTANKLVVFSDLELLFAYGIDLNPFRTLATDDKRIILLLPAVRKGGVIYLYPEYQKKFPGQKEKILPSNLVAEDHLWELKS